QADSNYERRHAIVTVTDGGVTITAVLDHLDGADVHEIYAHFVDAEFRADWEAAAAVHGDNVAPALLDRTDRQRQADALVTICRTAPAASPGISGSSEPNVTIIVDERTLSDTIVEFDLLPAANPFTTPLDDSIVEQPSNGECGCEHAVADHPPDQPPGPAVNDGPSQIVPDGDPLLWSQRRCETNTGVVIDPYTAVLAVLQGYVKWQMVDRLGNPLAATSKQRFFRGPIREAVMSVSDRCICPGCRRRTGAAQADHLDEHQHGGATAMSNGGPVCGKHNRFKSRHNYRPRRDHRGHWHLYDQRGNIVA
ncbi:MAG TPA: HNH endonuclease signature motif containing protein, partial [Ilumatobacter sp.]|nr:HNH endonuclease signature motif containing protein [Ilumatobacter sp.]